MRLKIFVTIAALLVGLLYPVFAAEQTALTQTKIASIRTGIAGLKTTLGEHQRNWCKKEVRANDADAATCIAKYRELIGKFSNLDAKLGKISWEQFVTERDALVPIVDKIETDFNPDKPKQAAAR